MPRLGWSRCGPLPRPLIDRLLESIKKQPSGCWEWQKARRDGDGHGFIKIRKKMCYAHRIAWEIYRGPIPDGMQVCHRCDNPPCINPDHLFLGTQRDNNYDCIAKGRARSIPPPPRPGALQANATKLTPEMVRTILETPCSTSEIARRLGIGRVVASRIRNGKHWACSLLPQN
jgi:hypothetical protein